MRSDGCEYYHLDQSSALYAHAAAGPEYAYPACLQKHELTFLRYVFGQISYGAIIALAPEEGNPTGACFEESVPMHSVFVGTAFSQPSS